ncbi:MAG: S8 family serine peptidase [Dokdonella sp.]|uniref:S8 family serine peptidase n=1 Tax=Dokdonella sp. TaxID=2291710 RepID=UPI003F805135
MLKILTSAILVALAGANLEYPTTARAADARGHRLEFSAHPFDPRDGAPAARAPFHAQDGGAGLHLVQFEGPVRQAWLDELAARGIEPVQYIPNDGYIVWADAAAAERLADLHRRASWLGYAAPLQGFLKLDPLLDRRFATTIDDEEVDVVVQVYAHDGAADTRRFVEQLAVLPARQRAPLGSGRLDANWAPILKFHNLDLRVHLRDIPAIAERADVSFVGERLPPRLLDEKQTLLLSGDPAPGPASHDHLQFLLERGFPQAPAAYPLIDLTDSTLHEGGTGIGMTATADPMLHESGDLSQPARVTYFENCSSLQDNQVGAVDSHGTLNANIIAGYDQRGGWPFQDAEGQHLGLGVNPFARVGSTTIFVGPAPSFDVTRCGGNDQGIVAANARNGAKISSNSWGSGATGTYGERDQVYDAAVRDVDAAAAGSQPMIYLVAASNAGPGPGSVGSPGSGKNVITVGASENLRPFDGGSRCEDDGFSAADDPQSIAGFSSRGPVAGDRVKPEVVGPGTHILGAVSIYSGFQGGGVCIANYPAGQTVFASSSGTSHSTPALSGVASLAYWWIENGGGGDAHGTLEEVGGARAPSPARMKAWLIAHPTYLTGVDADDDLPSNDQGYGMPNMQAMFDATAKVLLDQSERFDAGGETRDYAWGVPDPTRPVRIALAWTDAPGALGASPQVNDLDLEVEAGGVTYHGNHFDHQWSTPGGQPDERNNYEAVFLPAGTVVGDVRIHVRARNIAGDGVPGVGDATDQDFALACINCTQLPSFTMTTSEPSLQVCAGGSREATLHLEPIVGFASPVTLALDNAPAGIDAAFAPNPASPPADASLHLDATAGMSTGAWPVTVTGTSPVATRTLDLGLTVYDARPVAPTATAPADGSSGVSATPTFTWDPVDDAHSYLVQVATDAAFTRIVRSHETAGTAWTIGAAEPLQTSSRYWWRVIARNACGDSDAGADRVFASGFEAATAGTAQEFTTLYLAGDCPVDSGTVLVFADDLDGGGGGWTHGAAPASSDRWTLESDGNGETYAWQASAPASGAPNDAWLVSPSVALPSGLSPLTLGFLSRQSLKAGATGTCNDGAIVEASVNGGSSWTQLTGAMTDPLDGTIAGAFGNPLAGKSAWCGDPQAYRTSVMDIESLAGQTVKFRFRIGHDRFPHRAGVNWAIDNVRVAGCTQ